MHVPRTSCNKKIPMFCTFYYENKHQLQTVQDKGDVLQHINNYLF
jgi:hypothetical protein